MEPQHERFYLISQARLRIYFADRQILETQQIPSFINWHRDFPKPGVTYWDFTGLLANPADLKAAIEEIKTHFGVEQIQKIAAVEAKGFTVGAALAYDLGVPLVLIRKPELTPGEVDSEKFQKEYGFGEYQLKRDGISTGERVLIVYDIMAGPGATQAAVNLVTRAGGTVLGIAFILELEYLKGREQLDPTLNIFSLVKIKEVP